MMEYGTYIMRLAPVPRTRAVPVAATAAAATADGGGTEGAPSAVGAGAGKQKQQRGGRALGEILIAHIDGRRFLNLEQRAARGLPEHIPKYDI
jgi:hypothetical protein